MATSQDWMQALDATQSASRHIRLDGNHLSGSGDKNPDTTQ